jgi:hypothetical protein
MNEHHLRAISLLDSRFLEPTLMLIADDPFIPSSHVFVFCKDCWVTAAYLQNLRSFIYITPMRDAEVWRAIDTLDLEVCAYGLEKS